MRGIREGREGVYLVREKRIRFHRQTYTFCSRYKGGKTKCYITTELKTHCKSLCVRAFGRFAR